MPEIAVTIRLADGSELDGAIDAPSRAALQAQLGRALHKGRPLILNGEDGGRVVPASAILWVKTRGDVRLLRELTPKRPARQED